VAAADVKEILARHAPTLELVRRAADKPGCRFIRDWSRPSFDMHLPEFASLRNMCRLLGVAARSEAAGGDHAAALRDIVRIHRIGMHAAGEPMISGGLVDTAIDTYAIMMLAAMLPMIGKEDLPLLDDASLTDFIGTIPSYERHLLGEEALGIAALADLADGRCDLTSIGADTSPLVEALAGFFRGFSNHAELAGYREVLRRYQSITSNSMNTYPEIRHQLAAIESDVQRRQAGMLAGLMTPALGRTVQNQFRSRALHRAAEVLLAATRFRLATGGLPESMEALVPDFLARVPLDPFTKDAPLRLRRTDDGGIVVYAVGPDGADEDGPGGSTDDVGLSLRGGT